MQYTVIIEKSENNYSAWAPDLPGCVTTGPTVEETLTNMREDGDPIPLPTAMAAVVEVADAA